MVFIQKRQILNTLLPLLLLTCVTIARAESNQPLVSEIFQRVTSADREVSSVGKRISISWEVDGCLAREELVIHQPPSIHFLKLLAPSYDWNRRTIREERHKRGRRGRDGRSDGHIKRRFGRREFFRPPQRMSELMSQKNLALLTQNYNVQYASLGDEIAGYETDLLKITPRFEHRPTKHIWIARDKGIVLRVEDLDAQGNLRFMSVYTQISFEPEKIEEIKQGLDGFPPEKQSLPDDRQVRGKSISLSEAREALDHRLVVPRDLPPGFQLHHVTLIELQPNLTAHLRYTDGLMGFSLFESKRKGSFAPFGLRRRPPHEGGPGEGRGVRIKQLHGTSVQIMTRRQIHILRWFQEEVGFTLIGELNQPEMTQIAESLIRGGSAE